MFAVHIVLWFKKLVIVQETAWFTRKIIKTDDKNSLHLRKGEFCCVLMSLLLSIFAKCLCISTGDTAECRDIRAFTAGQGRGRV